MSEQIDTERPAGSGQLTDGLERVWSEIKQISKQVELETRRSGRIARLRLDIRRLRREIDEVNARLGAAVYAARNAGGDKLALEDVEGFAGGVAGLDALHQQISEKEDEIEGLRQAASATDDEPPVGDDQVAEEPANG